MTGIWRKKILSVTAGGFVLAAAVTLGGCTLDSPTTFSQKRAEVVAQPFHYEFETALVDTAALETIGRAYHRYGAGPLDLTVTYNPSAARGNTAMTATENAARIARVLARMGAETVRTDIMPVMGAEISMAHFDFSGTVARAPEGCTTFEDVDDSAHENYRDYVLGCGTETYVARQISQPSDLLGRAETDTEDGRRLGNVISGSYRSGVPNESLDGEMASGN